MKITVTVDLNVPGLGQDENVSARVIAADAFKLAVEKLRAYGVASIGFSRNTASVVLSVPPDDLAPIRMVSEMIETELRAAFESAKKVAREAETQPRIPASITVPDTAEIRRKLGIEGL
jgi:hypothetical protein